jgi:hypothetical protein
MLGDAPHEYRLLPIEEVFIMVNELGNLVPFSELTDEHKKILFGTDAQSEHVEKLYGEYSFSVTPQGFDTYTEIVRIVQSGTSSPSAHPNLTVLMPSEYRVVGGGARVSLSGAENLLTASHPVFFDNGQDGWFGCGKANLASADSITVWAIGLTWRYKGIPIP